MRKLSDIAEYTVGALFNVVFIALAAVAIYMVSTKAYAYGKDLFIEDTDLPYAEYTVVIPEGAEALEIGKILEDNGLTKSAWIFYAQSRLNGLYKYFNPGTYTFNTDMDSGEIMQIMQQAQYADVDEVKILIPEGLNLRQIGDLCEAKGLFSAAEFLTSCAEYGSTYYFLDAAPYRSNHLEGYLFPDTYLLPENPTPKDLIDRMLNRFQEKFDFEMEGRCEELGITIDQAIIIASVIEKEIKVDSERAKCSSIIYNRLSQNIPLQMCTTVLYVLDKQKNRLLLSDLQVESPYNTYIHSGLPIGPICNPGEAAIKAALYPESTNYLYMVLSDEQKGEHVFTSDYNEFLDAKARYNQQF